MVDTLKDILPVSDILNCPVDSYSTNIFHSICHCQQQTQLRTYSCHFSSNLTVSAAKIEGFLNRLLSGVYAEAFLGTFRVVVEVRISDKLDVTTVIILFYQG